LKIHFAEEGGLAVGKFLIYRGAGGREGERKEAGGMQEIVFFHTS